MTTEQIISLSANKVSNWVQNIKAGLTVTGSTFYLSLRPGQKSIVCLIIFQLVVTDFKIFYFFLKKILIGAISN